MPFEWITPEEKRKRDAVDNKKHPIKSAIKKLKNRTKKTKKVSVKKGGKKK